METIFNKKDAVNASLVIKIGPVDYQASVDTQLKQYAQKAAVKGFRPGKTPTSFVKKVHGKNILIQEITRLVANEVNNYIKNNKLKVLGEPIPDQDTLNQKWDNQTDFEFSYKIGLAPEFEIPTDVALTSYNIAVSDSVVNDALASIKQQFAEMEDVDSAEKGDILVGDVTKEGVEVVTATLLPLAKVAESQLSKFLGLKVGDKVTFDVNEVLGNEQATLAAFLGKNSEDESTFTGTYTLEINNVRRQGELEFDQELFDKVLGAGVATTKEEFIAKIKEVIGDNYKRESKNTLSRDIQKTLIDKAKIDLPNDFLKEWLFAANQGKISKEQIEMEYDYYAKELKWNLIQSKVAKDLEVKISDEEILEQAKVSIMSQFGGMQLDEKMNELITNWAQNFLKEEDGKNYYKIADQILYSKVIEHFSTTLKISEKNVTADQFQEILKEEVAN
ncbi:MAG: hypothetical protein RLZZ175_436 [Bacteroidota bacterium]|jgi:trigger factor